MQSALMLQHRYIYILIDNYMRATWFTFDNLRRLVKKKIAVIVYRNKVSILPRERKSEVRGGR